MSRSIEELEFERNRQEILKRSRTKTNKGQYATPIQTNLDSDSSRRFAWEYEIEVYKEQKKKEKFFTIGAWCGILSLILTLVVHYKDLIGLVIKP